MEEIGAWLNVATEIFLAFVKFPELLTNSDVSLEACGKERDIKLVLVNFNHHAPLPVIFVDRSAPLFVTLQLPYPGIPIQFSL